MPVLNVIFFLRHATNCYQNALQSIEADQAAGKMHKRQRIKGHFIKRRAPMPPEVARYEYLLRFPSGANLGNALVEAMNAIEADFVPLARQLPTHCGATAISSWSIRLSTSTWSMRSESRTNAACLLQRPAVTMLHAFREIVTPIHAQFHKLDEMNQQLHATHDLLLPRLMNGEIPV